jgi:hypothetical protein
VQMFFLIPLKSDKYMFCLQGQAGIVSNLTMDKFEAYLLAKITNLS